MKKSIFMRLVSLFFYFVMLGASVSQAIKTASSGSLYDLAQLILMGIASAVAGRELFLRERSPKIQITKLPGTKLRRFIRFFYSTRSVEKIFDPIYADFCEEYFAALAAGETWHARWIRVRYYKDFVKAVNLFGIVRLAKMVFAYWVKIA